jgi:hypothetical protein
MNQLSSESVKSSKKPRYFGGSAAAFRFSLKSMALVTLISLGIATVAFFVFGLVMILAWGTDPEAVWAKQITHLSSIIPFTGAIYLFVMGICWPFWLPFMLANGITRRQFACANLASAAALSLGFVLLGLLVGLIAGFPAESSIPSNQIVGLFTLFLDYLLGWLIAVGFQYRRVITATAGIVLVILITTAIAVNPGDMVSVGTYNMMPGSILSWGFLLTVVFCAVLALLLPWLTQRLTVKC